MFARNIAKNIFFATLLAAAAYALLSCRNAPDDPREQDVQTRLDRLQRVEMEFDASRFPERKKELLKTLLLAGKLMHKAYLHQVYPRGIAIRDSLAKRNDEMSKKLLRLIIRNGGPFDRMDGFKNFYDAEEKNPGAAFYPPDMTKEEFDNALAMNPQRGDAMKSPYTVLRRDGNDLIAVPFHKAFAEWVEPAAGLLQKASGYADQPSLKKFLLSRADALLSDDYYQSHLDWIDLVDSDIDLLLAPDEVYDDALYGVKASYEVSVMIKDSLQSAKLAIYTRHLNELEMSLPMEDKYKRTITGLQSPMQIVTDIYRGGDIAVGYQAVAATLPNDPKVQSTKGTKKIFWKNLMDARVNQIILPIGRELLASDQIQYISPEGVFNVVLVHEICHALGPIYVNDSLTVNQALKEHYTAIEETKADIVGLHSLRYFVEKGIIHREMERVHYVSALASIFRTIRFGTTEAHGKAALCQLNYFRLRGAVRLDPVTKKWSIVFDRMPAAITDLARELLILQSTGDYEGVEKFFKHLGAMPKEVQESLRGLDHLPVDIEPVYRIKWN